MTRKLWSGPLVVVALLALVGPAAAQPDETLGGAQPPLAIPETQVATASDDARDKIHVALAEEIEAAPPTKNLGFVARIVAGTDLSEYATRLFTRPYVDPLGNTVAVGEAKPAELEKLAGLEGVRFLQLPESIVDPPQPVDPEVQRAQDEATQPAVDPEAPAPGPAPQGWYSTGGALHRSQAAWEKGFTGEGVRYMSNDSGADYCHPDLQGTWATIEDETSPYHGLPQMFDSFSSYLAASDYYVGTSYVADGVADYADTSYVIKRARRPPSRVPGLASFRGRFQPLGAPAPRTYKLPLTSLSGEYHLGSHPDKALASNAELLSTDLGGGRVTAVEGERAGVLVTDETTAGVYDTVYVDLNYNFDFTDDKPARLTRDGSGQETACLDYDGDGLNDVSGGLVYFIADGQTPVPTLDWYWGIPGEQYGNGDLVAFHVMDFLEGGGNHGMGTTSSAVGQGVVRGSVIDGPEGPPVAEGQGLVVGPGKDVASTQNGNWYVTPFVEDGYIYAALGYDATAGTSDDVQIVSNSWGYSAIDNDGWDDLSRLTDAINRQLNPTMALLFSTGNGAAGYGTVAPPSPLSGIGVGASTLFGETGSQFEAIASADQITGGDPMSWSNRGPGARNTVGADVIATGAFGTGSVALNEVLSGAVATGSFGGTSQAAPIAAGNLALIYDAWQQRTGAWPTFTQARELLMGTARNVDHDVFSQGAGLVDADAGTDAAAGLGATYASPAEWSVGDYRGTEYPGFANVIGPGESDTQEFTLANHGSEPLTAEVGSGQFTQLGTADYSFTSLPQERDHGLNTTPDYAFRIDQDVPPGTDLLQVRVTKPYDQFDPDDDQTEPYSDWRVHLQNWTDLNGDGEYWIDVDGDGKVAAEGEMQTGEHIRFTYGYNTGPTQQARMSNSLERIDDGLLLTFQHLNRLEEVDTTDLTVEVSFWQRASWDWVDLGAETATVTIPPGGTATVPATLNVPADAPLGMYEGALIVDDGKAESAVPITVAVAAEGTSFDYGGIPPQDALYDNGRVFGYTDYRWRAESGDWRFFWTDVPAEALPETGTAYLVTDTSWQGEGNDLDTVVLGPTPDDYSPSDVYGPYTLETVGSSPNTNIGGGRWRFDTSSGGPRDLVAAPATEGLHGVFLHHVKVDGRQLDTPFSGTTGLVTVNPSELTPETLTAESSTGSAEVTVSSELAFEGFAARGFGLSQPEVTTETVNQDDPDDPASASFTRTVTLDNAALLEVATGNSPGNDLDLFVYGPDGALVGSSTTPTADEFVSILLPEDGEYTIAVQGWSVPAGTATFDLSVDAVQGDDVTVSDVPEEIPAGGQATLTINWDATGKEPGTYRGFVFMGPSAAPALLRVPLTITVPE